MKKIKIKQVDAFTRYPFGGNPAGVVIDAKDLNEYDMQNIAKEMNLSETAFVFDPDDPKADFKVRFFTPKNEVDLCGHATIATFHALVEEGKIELEGFKVILKQETRAGVLPVEISLKKGMINIMMTQTIPKFRDANVERKEVAQALRIEEKYISEDPPMEIVSTGLWHLIVPIKNLKALEKVDPDFSKLSKINNELGAETTHLFTFETLNPDSTVHTRDFAPLVGVNEDPATGTGNGALGAYLAKHRLIEIKEPVTEIIAEQGFEIKRPSEIFVEINTENEEIRDVKVGGFAVTVLNGEIIF
ncbi:MAG: PhzF family phenazine biosynthesis protein [Candidatus Hydrothermarchaeota archaeon]